MLPGLIVFDLDFTLWDCGGTWVDCTSPPFACDSDGRVRDRGGRTMRLYHDVPGILDRCEDEGFDLAVASRTHAPEVARDLMELLGVRERFHFEEIYPGSKVPHFQALAESSGVPLTEMLFFDDELRNIEEVGALGVTAVHVGSGMDLELFENGLAEFAAGR